MAISVQHGVNPSVALRSIAGGAEEDRRKQIAVMQAQQASVMDRQKMAEQQQDEMFGKEASLRDSERTLNLDDFERRAEIQNDAEAERMRTAQGMENDQFEFKVSATARAEESKINEARRRIETDPEWQGPEMAEARANALRQLDVKQSGIRAEKVLKDPDKFPEGRGPGQVYVDPVSGVKMKNKY
jgi:hypothetical protein